MAELYGLGYGLARMAEGATGGMLEAEKEKRALKERQDVRTQEQANRARAFGLEERRLLNAEETAGIQRGTQALSSYLSVLEKTGNQDAAKAIYAAMDPEGDIPDIVLRGDELIIDYKGFRIKGQKEQLKQAVNIIGKNPERVPDVLDKLSELGLAEITVPKEEEGNFTTFDPDKMVMDKEGNIIYQGKPTLANPSAQLTQMKLTAWNAYFKGVATPQQKELIGVDKDPYVAQVAKMVNDDDQYYLLSAEEKAKKTMEIAEIMRKANSQSTQGANVGISQAGFTQTATNPQTGEKIGWNGKEWVPIQ